MPDVVDAGDLAHVLDVRDDLLDRRVGLGVLAAATSAVKTPNASQSLASTPDLGGRRGGLDAPLRGRGGDELRHEGHHAHAAVGRQRREHVVGHVARGVAQREGAGVAEDRPARSVVSSAARMVVAATWLRSTIMPRRFISRTTSRPNALRPPTAGDVGGRVGPRRVVVVGQRQVAHPEHVQHPQGAERAADRVAALGPEQRRDPARRRWPARPRRRCARGPAGRHTSRSCGARRRPARAWPRRRRRPAACSARTPTRTAPPTPPSREAGQVGLRRRHRRGDVERLEVVAGLLARRPRQVVVTVDRAGAARAARGPGRARRRRARWGGRGACWHVGH